MNLLIGAAVIIFLAVLAIGVMLFVRRNAPEGSYISDSDRASGIFGMIAGGFAILLGFIVFLAFASYDQSRAGAEREAVIVVQQYQTAQFFDPETAADLTGALVCYGRYVVYQEWPEMEDGSLGDSLNPWGTALFIAMKDVQLENSTQETAFGSWMDQTFERQDARQDRVHGAEGIMSWPLWVVLVVMALVVFGFMLMFADSAERWWVQAAQVGAVVAVTVATMLVIRLFETPFQDGVGGLEPVAMERTLDIMNQVSDVGIQGDPPCAEDGQPL